MSNPPLHREVIKWLQGLELSFYPKNVHRDFSNGYLIAEILSHYYPRDFSMHSYHNGVSFFTKQQNWRRIQQLRENLNITADRGFDPFFSVPAVQRQQADFTDQESQQPLPSLARSTASRAVKNNLTATEVMAAPDMSTNQRKAQL